MLSIVAVVIDNLEVTRRFVSSIRQFTQVPYELILVDNASHHQENVEEFNSTADIFFRFEERTDLAKAWNQGIALATGDYIAVVNNDIVVPPQWFETLRSSLDQDAQAGMVSPVTFRILKRYIEHNRFRNFDKSFSQAFALRPFREIVWGEFCLFRRAALEEVGGYCELYLDASGEDLEMCQQLHAKGWKIMVDPRVFVYHQGDASLGVAGRNLDQRQAIWRRNNALYKSRWQARIQNS